MIERVLILLTTPPGNIAYFLVLLISIGGAFHGSWEKRYKPIDADLKWMLVCLLILAGSILIPFSMEILPFLNNSIPHGFHHLVEDICITIGITWIIKCWLDFEQPMMKYLLPFALTAFLFILGVILCLVNWQAIQENSYLHSITDNGWHIMTAILIALAMVVLFIKRKKGLWLGAVLLCLMLAGQILYLITFYPDVDPNGTVRIFQLLAFPFMLALPAVHPNAKGVRLDRAAVMKLDIYETLVKPIINRLEDDKGDFKEEFVKIMTYKMEADRGYLIQLTDDETINLFYGWEAASDEMQPDATFHNKNMTEKLKELTRGGPLVLDGEDNPGIRDAIFTTINVELSCDILLAPIPKFDESSKDEALLMINPVSRRMWQAEDVTKAGDYCKAIGPFYNFHDEQMKLSQEFDQINTQVHNTTKTILDFHFKNQWFGDKDLENQKLEEMVNRLLVEIENFKRTIDNNQKNDDNKAINPIIMDYQARFKLLLGEVARLKQELENAEGKAKQKTLEAGNQKIGKPIGENPASISEKIREPLSVILGYTDELLSESVGILAEKQFKCLYKIKASSMLIQEYLDDITDKTTDLQEMIVEESFFDLNPLIDRAIMLASGIMKERKLALQLEIPPDLERISIKQNGLQEIINQVFMISCELCEEDGIIRFHLDFTEEDEKDILLIKMEKLDGKALPEVLAKELEDTEQSQKEKRPVSSDLQQRMRVLHSLIVELSGKARQEDLPTGGFSISLELPCQKEI